MPYTIEIDSDDRYQSIFPNRKLVTKDTLRMIKYLRQDGHKVIVKPKNDWPVEYLFHKGLIELFTNPVFIYFLGIGSGIATNLISNAIQKVIDNSKEKKQLLDISSNIVININNHFYQLDGKKSLLHDANNLKKKQKKFAKRFEKTFLRQSPFAGLDTPIYLEHNPKIVGWGRFELTSEGFITRDNHITDKKAWELIQKGEIKGGSLTGIAKRSLCNICNSDYVQCNHIAGDNYEGKMCLNNIMEAEIVEFSLVRTPVNPNCIIDLSL